MLNYVDLYAGIGGFGLPFHLMGGKCLMMSESDKFARQTYLENNPVDNVVEDANDIEHLPDDTDILLAGFPCQPFSKAGRREGFSDPRGTAIFNIVRLLETSIDRGYPVKYFLFENVPSFVSVNDGEGIKYLTKEAKRLGYQFHYRMLDSSSHVPQKRKRVFMFGVRQINDIFYSHCFDVLNVTERNALFKPDHTPRLGDILENSVDRRYVLTNQTWSCLQRHREKHKDKGNGFGYRTFGHNDVSGALTSRYHHDGAEILIENYRLSEEDWKLQQKHREASKKRGYGIDILMDSDSVTRTLTSAHCSRKYLHLVKEYKDRNPRRLTPRECARLMGFPDSFRISVSDTQAYKQFGNSVVVPLVAELAIRIKVLCE